MKIILIAAIAPGGVIGRSKKPCACAALLGALFNEHGCTFCEGHGFVPCNELPWPPGTYPEDMEHFKKVTMGHAVVMGRNTKDSIPSKFFPLEGRTNIVVSKTEYRAPYDPGWRPLRFESLPDALQDLRRFHKHHDTLYVIGGARLYAEALPIADELDLTLVSKKWDGDVLFPKLEAGFDHAKLRATFGPFECVSREPCPTNPDLTFTKWVRR